MKTSLRFLLASLASLALASPLAACSSTTCHDCGAGGSGGGSGGGTTTGVECTGTIGKIVGHVDYSPDFSSSPVANAMIGLRKAPQDEPIYAKADANGDYEVEIEAGAWIITGEDSTGCYTDEPAQVTVEACKEIELDLVLDVCTG